MEENKMIFKKIKIPMYGFILYIGIGKWKNVRKEFIKKTNIYPDKEEQYAATYTSCYFKGTDVLMDVGLLYLHPRKKLKHYIKSAAHEIDHATWRILECVSVECDNDNHEAHAYLMGYLMNTIFKILKQKGH
jgi:hypothetical protein